MSVERFYAYNAFSRSRAISGEFSIVVGQGGVGRKRLSLWDAKLNAQFADGGRCEKEHL
jgi:hypothetical protein